VSADLSSFTGRGGARVVEPGDLQLQLSASSNAPRLMVNLRLVGPERFVGFTRRLVADVTIE